MLTPQGQRYAADVRKALMLLGDAAVQYGDKGIRGSLTVSCTPGFASLWLCNHVGEFKQLYPDVTLRIVTPPRLDESAIPRSTPSSPLAPEPGRNAKSSC